MIYNRCTNPAAMEFDTSKIETTVNIASKHRKIFAVIKMLDTSATIIIGNNITIDYSDKFPMGIGYAHIFTVFYNRKNNETTKGVQQ